MAAGLGFALALVARDLAFPLLVTCLFGLVDRVVTTPLVRVRPAR